MPCCIFASYLVAGVRRLFARGRPVDEGFAPQVRRDGPPESNYRAKSRAVSA